MSSFVISAFYKFVSISDINDVQKNLLSVLNEYNVRGSILVAPEGINGTVASNRQGMDALIEWFKSDSRFNNLIYKESFSDKNPFLRSKVKLKREIVTIGLGDVDPTETVGTYVDPQDWNELIADPDLILIDARNDYEVEIGTFEGAINPNTRSFRELPDYLERELGDNRHTRVAMFCTGGIRCEKSTSFLKMKGFDEVYHLKGGILKYLEDVPEANSKWEGECFVFDERVSVDHSLQQGSYDLCRACRMPVSEEDKQSQHYVLGVSCPHCINEKDEDDRIRFREREKQIRLAHQRGEIHMGAETAELRKRKQAQKEREREFQRSRNSHD